MIRNKSTITDSDIRYPFGKLDSHIHDVITVSHNTKPVSQRASMSKTNASLKQDYMVNMLINECTV